MSVTDLEFRLPGDVRAVPDPTSDEVIVVRQGSRVPPQVLSSDAWLLLQRFREPATLSRAIIDHCAEHGGDPLQTLDEAFPVLVALSRSGLLVPEGTLPASGPVPRLSTGQTVGPATLVAPIRVLDDSELWEARLDDGSAAVVKVVDSPAGPELFLREISALRRLVGGPVPALLWDEPSGSGGTLVLGYVAGDPVDLAALDDTGIRGSERAMSLVLATLDAYVATHRRGVLHGDIHPGNVLADDEGRITLLDFGLAALPGAGLGPPPRPSGGEHLDPETASALLTGTALPELDVAIEVYALAALAYRVLTGSAHLDLQREREEALRAITSEPPRPFAEVGTTPWPAVEQVLARALSHHREDRPASIADLRCAFIAAAATPSAAPPDLPGDTPPAPPGALLDYDVGGRSWAAATPDEAVRNARLLQGWAAGGDVDAHDLALLWGLRAGASMAPPLDADA